MILRRQNRKRSYCKNVGLRNDRRNCAQKQTIVHVDAASALVRSMFVYSVEQIYTLSPICIRDKFSWNITALTVVECRKSAPTALSAAISIRSAGHGRECRPFGPGRGSRASRAEVARRARRSGEDVRWGVGCASGARRIAPPNPQPPSRGPAGARPWRVCARSRRRSRRWSVCFRARTTASDWRRPASTSSRARSSAAGGRSTGYTPTSRWGRAFLSASAFSGDLPPPRALCVDSFIVLRAQPKQSRGPPSLLRRAWRVSISRRVDESAIPGNSARLRRYGSKISIFFYLSLFSVMSFDLTFRTLQSPTVRKSDDIVQINSEIPNARVASIRSDNRCKYIDRTTF